ncbi:aminotransferase class IV [Leucobacter sp. W1153]|uniref:aminotransferase class IV n=1 Tax=Leucobacter sp. W1153 TaxID=3439064 RepID=UPI003F313B03
MTDQDRSGQLLAADSFRVRGIDACAAVRGWGLHVDRFARTAADCLGHTAERAWLANSLPGFLAQARADIAAFGDGFPRFELWRQSDGTLQLLLALRPLPQLSDHLAVRSAPGFALTDPHRKGPNIERLMALNRDLGAEALLLDAHGNILEGATTSILWWDGDTLCRIADEARVSSVTERLLIDSARCSGHPVASRRLPLTQFTHFEAWAVNALHGIRPISQVDGEPLPDPDAALLTAFREALDTTWEPLHPE